MSLPSSPTRERSLFLLGLACLGVTLVLTAGLVGSRLSAASQAIQPTQDITLTKSGLLIQGGQQVGQVETAGNSPYLDILASRQSDSGPSTVDLTLHLPRPLADPELGSSFTSIQGTDGMSAILTSPTEVSLYLPDLLPESHTIARLTFPADYFSLPPQRLLSSFLRNLPTAVWQAGSALFLLVVLLASLGAHSLLSPPSGQRNLPPDGLRAIEMSVLLNGRLRAEAISATLYDLARRGALQIIQKATQTIFLRSHPPADLHFYEEMLLNLLAPADGEPRSLQGLSLSLSEELFSPVASTTYVEVYNSLTARGYFRQNLRQLHLRFKTLGIGIQLAALGEITAAYFLPASPELGLLSWGAAAYMVGHILYQTGYRLVPLTQLGLQASQESYQLIAYLADRRLINQGPGLADPGTLFYGLLSYALVAGKQQEWLNRFAEERLYIPEWLTALEGDYLRPELFLDQIKHITDLISRLLEGAVDPNAD